MPDAMPDAMPEFEQVSFERMVEALYAAEKKNNDARMGTDVDAEEVKITLIITPVDKAHTDEGDSHIGSAASDEENNVDYYLKIAMLLEGVQPENIGEVTSQIVKLAAEHNAKRAAEQEDTQDMAKTGSAVDSSAVEQVVGTASNGDKATTKTSNTLEEVSAPTPVGSAHLGSQPDRDYRDSYGVDHGRAVRETYFNPPPNGWDAL